MQPVPGSGLQHAALFCEGGTEYQAAVTALTRAALDRGDSVLLQVPGERLRLLRELPGIAQESAVEFADIAEAGRNPAWLIPAIHVFAASRAPAGVSVISEPAWPARSPCELVEVAKHEALANLAFDGLPVAASCVYDTAVLPAGVLAAARQTHPVLTSGGSQHASDAYLGPGAMPVTCQHTLPAPPPGTDILAYRDDLRAVRARTEHHARLVGLSPDRTVDLVLAVSELAANTLRHTPAGGTLRIWDTATEVVCEVEDRGWIQDPLAGRRHLADPPIHSGLWVVNKICDLVQTRSGPGRTTTRLHMSLRARNLLRPPADQSHRSSG